MDKKEQLDPKAEKPVDQQGDESLKAEVSAPTNEKETNQAPPAKESETPEPKPVEEEAVEDITSVSEPAEELAKEPDPEKESTPDAEVKEILEEVEEAGAEAEKNQEAFLEDETSTEPVSEKNPEPTQEQATEKEAEPTEEILSEEEPAHDILAEEKPADKAAAEEKPAEEDVAEEVVAEEDHAEEVVAEEVLAEEDHAEEVVAEAEPTGEAIEAKAAAVAPLLPDSVEVEAEAEAEEEDEEVAEEESEGEEETEDLNERYGNMTREELVLMLEALVKHEDINYIRKHIGYVKAAFRKLLKNESLAHLEKSITTETEAAEDAEAQENQVTQETPVDSLSERFDAAMAIYKEKKYVFDQALEKQKQENLEAKEAILEELRNLIESEEELKKTYDQFRDLQEKWRDIGAVPQGAKNTLWNNYHFLVEKFFDKVKINKELKDLDLKKNLELKTELCEKAEELLLEPSIVKSFQRLQKLHEAWKETGPVPNDKKDEIWERFRAATEKLNKRRQEYYDGLRDEQQNNLAAKLVLCEKAEQLAAITPETPRQWQEQTNQINELFKMWKTIGFAPKKVNNEVWNRFRSALDSFFRNKKDFFQKFKDNQTENYNQKLNLCLQAEALKESTDWRRTTDELIALQQEWKKIGTVPSKFSDKIWKRFRAACDEFFKKKAAYFSNIGEMQEENLQKKKDIIEQIKNHPYTDDNGENLKIINEYQREWMDIGHVPIKQKDKIQAEYRKVIDEQFEKLGISKKAKSTLSFRSKIENIKNTPNADHIIYKERNFLLGKISTLQNDIKVWENNIGFFASSKKADILKNEFEDKIEKARQEITILEEKLKILRDS
ncbi:MAG: DUF349 domain-containing protein [Bacteroidales bacterium]|nr:DUF349 domain-containing protein [Bacteroidales bacterium]